MNDRNGLIVIFILLMILAAVVWLGSIYVTPMWPDWLTAGIWGAP